MKAKAPKGTKKVPMRRCVGCMESKPKKELIRIAGYEGEVSLDPTGKQKAEARICVLIGSALKKRRKRRR